MPIISPCPVMTALSVFGGKWKPVILWVIRDGQHRFSEIKRKIPPITQKILTQHLKELEADGIVTRKVFPEVPPRVEYSLTEYGRSLQPVMDAIAAWGAGHQQIVAAAEEEPHAAGQKA